MTSCSPRAVLDSLMRMHQRSARTLPAIRIACLAILSTLLSGCSSQPEEIALFDCKILIDGMPAPDVRVLLTAKAGQQDPCELVGVTDHLGVAGMKLTPGSAPPRGTEMVLRASLESLGDWGIREPWSSPEKSPLDVTWRGDGSPLEISLPRKAVYQL